MGVVIATLATIVTIYIWIMIARMVIGWIQVFAPDWRPKGVLAVVFEGIFTVTDPPLKAVGRFVPPLRIGPVAIDLAFIIVLLALWVIQTMLYVLAANV